LRRNLPFLPGPWQAFIENLTNQFGDKPEKIYLKEVIYMSTLSKCEIKAKEMKKAKLLFIALLITLLVSVPTAANAQRGFGGRGGWIPVVPNITPANQ
jgi:hypothetical protein